jgi:hypothetical protein
MQNLMSNSKDSKVLQLVEHTFVGEISPPLLGVGE